MLDGTASLPVSVYNGAKHEGNIDVNLSSIARDTNTFTSGILMRGVAAKEYLEGIHQGNNHDDVLSAVLKAHEHDGTCLQIDPNNPNRRAIEDFLSKVYRDRMIKTVDEELRTLPQETQNLPHKKQLQKLRSDLKNSGNTLGNLKDIAKNHLTPTPQIQPQGGNTRQGPHMPSV